MKAQTVPEPRRGLSSFTRKRTLRWLRNFIMAVAILAVCEMIMMSLIRKAEDDSKLSTPITPRNLQPSVGCLGRLTPESEVIRVAPPTQTGSISGASVETLMVSVGDEVKSGQVLAILDTHRIRAAAVHQQQAVVAMAKAKLALVEAGPKVADIRAQQAVISRVQADLADAQANFKRVERLINQNIVSRVEFETHKLRCDQARATLEQEQAKLEAMVVIRPEDIKVAEAELEQAEASLEMCKEDLHNSEVRSPISGKILKIHARAGEKVGDEGLLDMGNTSVMQVVAEVYEADISKVQIGQKARVRIPTMGEEIWLSAQVVSKDLVVARQDLFDNDPVADIDSRVVEVRIRLSGTDGAKVAELSNARVEVIIEVEGKLK